MVSSNASPSYSRLKQWKMKAVRLLRPRWSSRESVHSPLEAVDLQTTILSSLVSFLFKFDEMEVGIRETFESEMQLS